MKLSDQNTSGTSSYAPGQRVPAKGQYIPKTGIQRVIFDGPNRVK